MFTPDQVKNAVQNTLAADITIPEGHKNSFVTVVDKSGIHSAVATKVGNNWTIVSEIGFDTESKGWEAGITVQKTW